MLYNLEKTNLTGDRLSNLLILLSLAYLKSIIQGIDIKSKQVQEYLGRKTEKYRKYARHSTFYVGLWGESWVDSISSNWQVVVELMSLSPHKLPNYQQGLRAMRLILSAIEGDTSTALDFLVLVLPTTSLEMDSQK